MPTAGWSANGIFDTEIDDISRPGLFALWIALLRLIKCLSGALGTEAVFTHTVTSFFVLNGLLRVAIAAAELGVGAFDRRCRSGFCVFFAAYLWVLGFE